MLILFMYLSIGAIVALLSEIVLVTICKLGYDETLEKVYNQPLWLLLIEFFLNLFIWPEEVLSVIWYLIFKDISPWRKWLFGKIDH